MQLIYDGETLNIPDAMLPEDISLIQHKQQMRGTNLEQLCEIAGRACYDSLGKGRTSADYHKHILEVGHTSVLAHANITFDVVSLGPIEEMALALARLPGCYISDTECCINLRTIAEIDNYDWVPGSLKGRLKSTGHLVAPQIIESSDWVPFVPIDSPDEECQWITMFLSGSRGFSHEQVRHNYRCAISQRSTRYVDESKSPWDWHPLFEACATERLKSSAKLLEQDAKDLYDDTVSCLQAKLLDQGVDKFTARKQARGAARGFLGNALHTEVVFSASVAQWKRMFKQRMSPHADAEIRIVYNRVYECLQNSRYNLQLETMPSPDGLGFVLRSD